jgi:hypothetical protein
MRKSSAVILCALVFTVISCRLINSFTNDPNLKKVGELWSDVPRMEGLTATDAEMPMFVKVLMRTALNNLWRLNNANENRTPSTGDWAAFATPKSPDDVKNFYTNERMTSLGSWDPSNKQTCANGREQGFNGVACVFTKTANNRGIGLLIAAVTDDKTKQTNVFFVRVETDETPSANQPSPSSSRR